MGAVIVLAERVRDGIRESSLDAIALASGLGKSSHGPLVVAIIDREPGSLVPLVSVAGVDEVVLVTTKTDRIEPEPTARAVEALVREREALTVLLGQSVNGSAIGSQLAARLGFGFAGNVHTIEARDAALRTTREILGGKVEIEQEFPTGAVLLVAASGRGADLGGGQPAVTPLDLELPEPVGSRHVEFEPQVQGDLDLARAKLIVSVGRGIGDRDSIALFEELARKRGGVLGSSRPLVDAGWLPRACQVGQSGATVKPAVYLALGISGATEHVAGIRDSGTIVAVNTDPRARIFEFAQFGVVADACAFAEALIEA